MGEEVPELGQDGHSRAALCLRLEAWLFVDLEDGAEVAPPLVRAQAVWVPALQVRRHQRRALVLSPLAGLYELLYVLFFLLCPRVGAFTALVYHVDGGPVRHMNTSQLVSFCHLHG